MYLKNLVAEVFQRRDVPQYSAKLYKKIIKYFIFTKTSLEDLVKQIIEDERIVCPTKSFYEEEPEITPKILILFLFKWSN